MLDAQTWRQSRTVKLLLELVSSQTMPGAAASEAVGPIFASALTLTLSIVSIAWGSWAQADVILNQANTNLTGYGIGVANAEQIRLFEEDEFSEHKSLEEQQRIWPKGMPGGDSYAGTSCNGCGKANKITQRRGPTDWCVTLQQVVVGPHENPLRRRLQDVFEEYTNYSRWINTSCLSDSYYDEWWSTRCGPGNATFPGQLNTEAFRDACEEYKVVSRPLNESATAYSYVRPPACRSPACRPAPPFLPSARLAQEEYMAKTCDKWEAYCSTSRGAMSSVAGLQYTGIVFMALAMIAFLLSLGVAGKENNRFKIMTIVGFVVTLLAWIMLFCATVLFAQFNNTINDPRDTYVKMRVCRLRIILGRLVIPTPRPHTADLPLPSLYPRSLPPPAPSPPPPPASSRRSRHLQVYSRSESHFYDEGIVTYDVEETMGDAWMLPPKATSRDWWVRDPDTLNLWDWAPWSFSMGFYANIGALFWATATLSVAALAVGWCGCLRFCAPEHEAKPNAVPTVVSESKDAP